MSHRFVEVLRQHLKQPIDLDVEDILKDLLTRLESETAALKIKFSLFIEKKAPCLQENPASWIMKSCLRCHS